jgi:hypothetical protein
VDEGHQGRSQGGLEVGIALYLRDELLGYAMDRRAHGLPHELSVSSGSGGR